MTLAVSPTQRASQPSGLADVLDVILDKGIVIDAFVRVSLVGIELLTVDARVVIASVDTYLRFAEAVNRLDIQPKQESVGLPGLIGELQESGAEHKTRGALSGMKDSAKDVVASLRGDSGNDDDDDSDNGRGARRTNGRSRSSSSRSSSRRPVAAGRRSSRDSDED